MSTFEHARTGTDDLEDQTCPTLPEDDLETRGRALFVVCQGRTTEHSLPESGTVIIGRGHDADVRIDHPTLSRRHVKLTLGACVMVEDNHSRNGTRVGGRMLAAGEVAVVGPNMSIEAGDALLIVRSSTTSSGVVDVVTPTERIDAEISLVRALLRIANAEVSVLLVGEPGVGKTYLARRVHALSRRSRGPLVELDCRKPACGDIAMTAAAARGGILVIHEPAMLSPIDQTRLAEAITREGDAVRLVTIATRGLADFVTARALSADLARLLAGVSVVVPPLRTRLHELAGMIETFVDEIASENGRPVPRIDPSAVTALARHSWPGNIRELRDVLARAVLSCRSRVLTAADVGAPIAVQSASSTGTPAIAVPASRGAPTLPSSAGRTAPTLPSSAGRTAPTLPSSAGRTAPTLAISVAMAERERIIEALRACHGNQTRAAKMLGISRGTLIARLERFGLPRPRK